MKTKVTKKVEKGVEFLMPATYASDIDCDDVLYNYLESARAPVYRNENDEIILKCNEGNANKWCKQAENLYNEENEEF